MYLHRSCSDEECWLRQGHRRLPLRWRGTGMAGAALFGTLCYVLAAPSLCTS